MIKSTALSQLIATLSRHAHRRGLTDTQWAARAGVRKETLSRLRRRRSCDFETLRCLAQTVGMTLEVSETHGRDSTPDDHYPTEISREYEDRLVELCVSGDLDPPRWMAAGPRFFMAGLAVMLAGERPFNRSGLLGLSEYLHPGASEVAVFDRWLRRTPLRPSRFLPLIDARLAHTRAA